LILLSHYYRCEDLLVDMSYSKYRTLRENLSYLVMSSS
jgi:hypothetical protein